MEPPVEEESTEEPVERDTLICALTRREYPDSDVERTMQSLIEQLHREYHVEIEDMARDVRVDAHVAAASTARTKADAAEREAIRIIEEEEVLPAWLS